MLKVSISGIRGIWEQSLTEEILLKYLDVFVHLHRIQILVLGRDNRPSSPLILNLILKYAAEHHIEIINLELIPTPMVSFVTKLLKADGGIMISASHNPMKWNALKFIDQHGQFLSEHQINIIEDFVLKSQKIIVEKPNHSKPTSPLNINILNLYLDKIMQTFSHDDVFVSSLHVIGDTINSTMNYFFKPVCSFLKVESTVINDSLDQSFQRGAEPIESNLVYLKREVVKKNADIGFAFDPDGDRVTLIDENGNFVGENYTLALSYFYLLKYQNLNSDIVVNLSTSRLIEDIALQFNRQCFYSKIGESNVSLMMKEKKIILGGEGNGGVICHLINEGRDATLAMILIIYLLQESNMKLSRIIATLPKYYSINETVEHPVVVKKEILKQCIQDMFKQEYPEIQIMKENTEDGVRIDYKIKDVLGWIQLRNSNTEPIIRLMGECENYNFQENLKNSLHKALKLVLKLKLNHQ